MAKKTAATKKPTDAKDAGVARRLKLPKVKKPYEPNATEKTIDKYVHRRINEMQDFRRGLNIEGKWRAADDEYIPHELDYGSTRKRFEQDQDTGLRSRMVPVGDSTQQWRQQSSAPTLLAKIQTALSIIIDNMPEADLVALLKKYQSSTDLAYALWKRNWSITDAKEKLKLAVFDLIKYGWVPQRTYPRLVKFPKRILQEKDPENPENDKFSDTEVEWFNDIDRQPLDVYRTWIDEMSRPYDPLSTSEAYYEIDFPYDQFMVEFGKYENADSVPPDSSMVRESEQSNNTNRQTAVKGQTQPDVTQVRKDIVTVGFFESRLKDLLVLYIPRHRIVLYSSPNPNDDGYLSVSHTLWLLRTSKLPYGISLWEIIRQNKALYDKMKNMGMDQLVLSIMKFGFFSGTSTALGDGTINIVPGQARQLTTSSGNAKDAVNWMDIPGPGDDFWKGLEAVADMMDDDTGISPTLEGDITGKTLGEILHAKEASMKRMKTPLENIAWLVEQDAYVTLSWMSQVYSIPTIKEFADEKELMDYEKENEITHMQLFGQPGKDDQGNDTVGGPYQAHFLPQLALHLEDSNGKLTSSKESKFFQLGKDIMPAQLKWKGIFKVIPRSIIDSSETLVKATKGDVFAQIIPLLQMPPDLAAKPAQQLLKINEEDPKDWLPDVWLQYLETGKLPPPPAAPDAKMPAGGPGATEDIAPPAPPQGGPVNPPAPPAPSPADIGKKFTGLFNRKM